MGHVREVALCPQEDPIRVSMLVVKTKQGDRVLTPSHISSINGGVRSNNYASDWQPFSGPEGYLLLDRDLLDQQIIDVYGRKVVRVNDVDIRPEGIDPVILQDERCRRRRARVCAPHPERHGAECGATRR